MKLRMHENSLFAVLLRSRWWISFGVAIGLFAIARLLLPEKYVVYAMFFPLPFVVIGCIAAWRQARVPGGKRVEATIDALRGMSWAEFSGAIENAFRQQGYTVNRLSQADADFELIKAGRIGLVSCKRWKAARTGIEPLRDLYAARRAREAHECTYIAVGEISTNALAFAKEKNIRLLHDVELARLLPKNIGTVAKQG